MSPFFSPFLPSKGTPIFASDLPLSAKQQSVVDANIQGIQKPIKKINRYLYYHFLPD
jgi:hypothetical protein